MSNNSYSENPPRVQERFQYLGTETAFRVLARVQELALEGKDVINLGIGQPDAKPPPHVVNACIAALQAGHHGYTPSTGIPELRSAVAAYFNQQYALTREVRAKDVIIVPGGKVTMFQAISLMGGAGVEVAYPNPGFPIYGSMINFTGAKGVPYRLEEANNFRPSVDKILAALSDRTNLLILNNPSNPTGGLMSANEVDRLAHALKDFPHVTILSDEIYSRLIFDHHSYRSMLSYEWLRDRLIVLDGWSKTYAMTGWRVGMAIWPEHLHTQVERLIVNSHSCVNAPAQWGALAALNGSQSSVEEMRQIFQRRRDIVSKLVAAIPGLACNFPEGAFYVFLDVSKAGIGCADEAQNFLLEEVGVALISGNSFGTDNGNFLRLSFAASDEQIQRAFGRIATALPS